MEPSQLRRDEHRLPTNHQLVRREPLASVHPSDASVELVVLHLRPARAQPRVVHRGASRAFRDPSADVAVERPAVGRDPGLEAVPGRGGRHRERGAETFDGGHVLRQRVRRGPIAARAAARRRRRRGRGRDARDDDARDASRRRRDRRLSHASRRHRCSAPCEPTRATERCRPIRGKRIRVELKAPHCRAPLTLSRAPRPFSKRAREERRDR